MFCFVIATVLPDFVKNGCPQLKMIQLGNITANQWTGGDGTEGAEGPSCHCKEAFSSSRVTGNQGRSLVTAKRQASLTLQYGRSLETLWAKLSGKPFSGTWKRSIRKSPSGFTKSKPCMHLCLAGPGLVKTLNFEPQLVAV